MDLPRLSVVELGWFVARYLRPRPGRKLWSPHEGRLTGRLQRAGLSRFRAPSGGRSRTPVPSADWSLYVNLMINGRSMGVVGPDSLAGLLASVAALSRAEIWLSAPGSASLCLLKSNERAVLMLLRSEGDAGLTSRATEPVGDSVLQFTLANGQVDEYPAAWTVPFDDARRAVEYFWFSKAAAPFVSWHDAVS